MKLKLREDWTKTEFRCDLTRCLDELSLINKLPYYDLYYHYIIVDKIALEEKILPIRVPGGTVGAIFIDENNEIAMVQVDRDYVVKTYPLNTHEIIAKFIGQTIELPN